MVDSFGRPAIVLECALALRWPEPHRLRPAFTACPTMRRILVIEDDDDLRDILIDVLRGDGVHVEGAADGAAGLRLLRQGSTVDVILLDLMMPGLSGWEFIQELRRDPALAPIPVVVLSAMRRSEIGEIDAEAVLTKPVEAEVLRQCIEGLCQPD